MHELPDMKLPPVVELEETNTDNQVNAKNCSQLGAACKDIYEVVKKEAETDNFLLMLGGDHCIPIGTITGILEKRKNTGVVWVDAHADINTPATSSSGNMHGMPVGFLLGLVDNANKLPSLEWFQSSLSPKDIVYIGLRDLDIPEKSIIKKLGIKAYTMYDVDRLGIGRIMEEIDVYLKGKDIHLSYDIDAIDPVYAPSTGTTSKGGLSFREGNYICEALFATGRLKSMELVEVNPSLHTKAESKATLDMAMALIGSTMGQSIL